MAIVRTDCMHMTGNDAYPSGDWNPFQRLLEHDEDISVGVHEVTRAPDVPPIRVDLWEHQKTVAIGKMVDVLGD